VYTYDEDWGRIYVNGDEKTSLDYTNTLDTTDTTVRIGSTLACNSVTDPFNGQIDEIRISNTARSADWIATEHDNQDDPGTFMSTGNEEDLT
jgi:hypothetical protein